MNNPIEEIEERLEILEQAIREVSTIKFEYKGMRCEVYLGFIISDIHYDGSYEDDNTFGACINYPSREEAITAIKEAIDKYEQEASSDAQD